VIITRVRWAWYRVPFKVPYETARGAVTHRQGIIVRLETGAGVHGLGEGSLDPSESEDAVSVLRSHIQTIGSYATQEPFDDLSDVLGPYLQGGEAARAANCAFETAIADAATRTADCRLAEMMRYRPETGRLSVIRAAVPVNATIAVRNQADGALAASKAVAAGFRCLKVKVGMQDSVAAEFAAVKSIRRAIGPEVRLRLDANGAWDEPTAIDMIRALEACDIELVEQPVPAHEIDALGRVRAAVATRIGADEAVVDLESAQRALACSDVLVLKLMRLGGPATASTVAEAAHFSGRSALITTSIDTGIGTALALHLAATLPDEGLAHGLATLDLLEDDLIKEPGLSVVNGIMRVPDRPGLGVELDEDALMRYSDGWHEVS
jgi:L-alanine-DL-glutamate epimerase-like enolase superfamily enzyme